MIQVVNKQHREGDRAGKWDLYVHDGSTEGNLLVFSQQGYNNRLDAEALAERLFKGTGEPVDLLTLPAAGGGSHRMLR